MVLIKLLQNLTFLLGQKPKPKKVVSFSCALECHCVLGNILVPAKISKRITLQKLALVIECS